MQTTNWSLVRTAAGSDGNPEAEAALNHLLRLYWPPIYAFFRRRGCLIEESADQTQEFIVDLLQRGTLSRLDPEAGRFRSFLHTALRNFLANVRDRDGAAKRGGGQPHFSLDVEEAERHFEALCAREPTPAQAFDRRWAESIIERARKRLEEEYFSTGKKDLYDCLLPFLLDRSTDKTRLELARQRDVSVGAVDVAIHRLRQRFRRHVRDLVLETVENEDHVDAEVHALLDALCP